MSRVVEQLHDRTLNSATLDVETKEWVFAFSGKVVLQVGAPWRVVSQGRIALGWRTLDNGSACRRRWMRPGG